ncbi:MAG: Fe-S-containing hydro-lyase [Clostridia bacterium]|nr:Fe-S-containing hydro-lyase [Clostridia bacterium]
MAKHISAPLSKEVIRELKAGDSVLVSGVIYTARDAAHERMTRLFKENGEFPIDLKDQIIYYAGPCPAKPGEVIGSCGPTTSGRMDAYTPMLLDNGLGAMIGKGARSDEVTEAIKRNCAVYLGAIGGAGALIAECIKSAEVVAYDDLGTEAIRRLTVENLPAVVLTDCYGTDLYEMGQKKYRKI